jgi:CARDB
MSTFDDDDIQFDFFDEPETVEATQRRRLPRLEMPGGRGGGDGERPRGPRPGPPTGLVPLARLVGLIALAIVVVVGLVFWVGSCQGKSKHDEYATYAKQVNAISAADKKLGVEFGNELISPGLKQSDLETKLAEFAQQERQELAQAQQIHAPGPLRTTHQQLLDAIQLRYQGLAGLGNTLAAAGSSKNSTDTVTALTQQGQLLTSSDVVWENLYRQPALDTLKQQGVTGVAIPKSAFLSNPDLVSARAFTILQQRLSGATTGGTPSGLHGDGLVGVHVSPQGVDLSTSTATTIKVSADLDFRVTVENSGDFPEGNVLVTLTIDAGGKPIVRTDHITAISAKEQTTVDFTNFDLPPSAFGQRATITVKVGKVPGETNLSNNSATYTAFFTLS